MYFDTVSVGVNVVAYNNVVTTRCDFKVGNGNSVEDIPGAYYGCRQNIGILLQNANEFTDEENTFNGSFYPDADSPLHTFGTVVVNSGYTTNRVYKSTFDSLMYGVYSVGSNRNTPSPLAQGLKVRCNTFTNNVTDVNIAPDAGTYIQGMSSEQGSTDTSAGNTFTPGCMTEVQNAAAYTNFYWYASGEHPTTTTPATVFSYAASHAANCPTGFDPSGIMDSRIPGVPFSARRSGFRMYRSVLTDSLDLYHHRVDFGNTDSLLDIIKNSSDTAALFTTLSAGSPYISTTAFIQVADFMALPYYSVVKALQLNPDNLRNADFVTYMDKAYTFTSDDIDTLTTAAHTVTGRTHLEGAITWLHQTVEDEGNAIITTLKSAWDTSLTVADTTDEYICMDSTSVYYLLDSNSYYAGLDSLDRWLRNVGDLWTNYERTGFYDLIGQQSIADSIFTHTGHILPPNSPADTEMYNSYSKLWAAIKSAESDGRTIFTLDSVEIASIDTFSTPPITYNAGMMGIMVVTEILTGPVITIPIPCAYEAEGKLTHGNTHEQGPITKINTDNSKWKFKVYPNPSNGIVTFTYDVPDGCSNVSIQVTNLLGETVMEQNTGNATGSIKWDPSKLPGGIYLYKASCGKGNISIGKIVLVR